MYSLILDHMSLEILILFYLFVYRNTKMYKTNMRKVVISIHYTGRFNSPWDLGNRKRYTVG